MTDKSDNNPSSKHAGMRQLNAKELMEVSGGLGNWINPLTRQLDLVQVKVDLSKLVVNDTHRAYAEEIFSGKIPLPDTSPSNPAAG